MNKGCRQRSGLGIIRQMNLFGPDPDTRAQKQNPPSRRPRRWAAAACGLLIGLAACQSGGDADEPPQPPASAQWLAEIAHDGSQYRWALWDPTQPTSLLDVPLNAGIPHQRRLQARQLSADGRQATSLGDARLVYLLAGRLYTIDLRAGASHTPVQVSSADRLCALLDAQPLQADAAVAVVTVSQRPVGSPGCGSDESVPDPTVVMRTDMSASTPPVEMGLTQLTAVLPDAAGQAQVLLFSHLTAAAAPKGLKALNAQLQPLPEPTLPQEPTSIWAANWLGADPATQGLGYLQMESKLWALRWDAAGARVAPEALDDLPSTQTLSSSGPEGLSYVNGARVRRVLGSQVSVLADLDLSLTNAVGDAQASVVSLQQTGGHLWLLQSGSGTRDDGLGFVYFTEEKLLALPKAGGTAQELQRAGATSLFPGRTSLQLLGGTADQAVVALISCGSPGCLRTSLLINPATGASLSLPGSGVGVLRAATAPVGSAAAVTQVLQCVPVCQGGQLQQMAPDGSGPIDLGPMTLATGTGVLPIDGQAQLPLHFSTAEFGGLRRDAWSLQPGVPGSLTRITRHLP